MQRAAACLEHYMMPTWQALLWVKRVFFFMIVMHMQSESSLEQFSYDGLKC